MKFVGRAVFLSALACGTAPVEDPDGGPVFIAVLADFNGFRGWRSVPATAPPGAPQPPEVVHGASLASYINVLPDAGASEFPVGTIIVKETTDGGIEGRQSFAMVKRGGNFNRAGAFDWEWFELLAQDDVTLRLLWRGAGPPVGGSYGGDPNACNDCHVGAQDRDYVWTVGLDLHSLK